MRFLPAVEINDVITFDGYKSPLEIGAFLS